MRLLSRSTGLIIFIGLFSLSASAQSGTLGKLRQELAMRYLEPAPHMALAKFYHDQGDRLQAFFILEAARRGRFEEPVFNQAFMEAFAQPKSVGADAPLLRQYKKGIEALFDKEPARAKALLTEALAKFPADGELRFSLGALLQREGKLREAEAQLVKAAELAPHSSYIQAWVGRFFFKVKADGQRALPFYLSAYFLDPHAYESEFVESRIRKITWEAAEVRLEQRLKSGASLSEIARDPNPTLVAQAVTRAADDWRPEYLTTMLALLGHDDEGVRWLAMEAIKRHVDRSFDPQLNALLQESDLRKRGLAAYIAVYLWKQESFTLMRNMLREEAQLLRFDAVSALILEGGSEGRRIVIEHRKSELNPTLQKLIDANAPKKGLSNRDL